MKNSKLFEDAKQVRLRAHAPYSKFLVGAALTTPSGKTFVGCNVENASYGATVCAERNALAAMVAAGEKSFIEITVVTDTLKGCPPCGICRQALAEFALDPQKTLIHMATTDQILKTFSLSDLLPEAFTGKTLKS